MLGKSTAKTPLFAQPCCQYRFLLPVSDIFAPLTGTCILVTSGSMDACSYRNRIRRSSNFGVPSVFEHGVHTIRPFFEFVYWGPTLGTNTWNTLAPITKTIKNIAVGPTMDTALPSHEAESTYLRDDFSCRGFFLTFMHLNSKISSDGVWRDLGNLRYRYPAFDHAGEASTPERQ